MITLSEICLSLNLEHGYDAAVEAGGAEVIAVKIDEGVHVRFYEEAMYWKGNVSCLLASGRIRISDEFVLEDAPLVDFDDVTAEQIAEALAEKVEKIIEGGR
jgi:hypothetical protein